MCSVGEALSASDERHASVVRARALRFGREAGIAARVEAAPMPLGLRRRLRILMLTLACGVIVLGPGKSLADGECQTLAQRNALTRSALEAEAAGRDARKQRWESVIAAQRACNDVEAEGLALAAWGEQSMRLFERDQALATESARYALAARAGMTRQRAESALRLGILLTELGQMELAETRLREASATFEKLESWSEAADAQSRLSRFNRLTGNYLTALTDEQAALRLRRRIDPPPNVWRSLLNLAVLYEQLELNDDSRRRYAEALDEAEREGNAPDVVLVLTGFAGFLSDFGSADASRALAMAERAERMARDGDDMVKIALALLQVGRAQLNLRHLDDADRAFAEALVLARKIEHDVLQAHILFRYGELALVRGDARLALERIDDARVRYEAQGNRHRLVKVHAALELVYQQLGDGLSAAQSGRERFRLRDELLGSQAVGRIGELLSRFELTEERRRSERLLQEKELAELKLSAERQQLQITYLVATVIGVALLLLAWRYFTANRLYRLLRDRNALVHAQAEQLAEANVQLTEQSERLYQASITDALTDVRNRAYGMQRLTQLFVPAAGRDVHGVVMLLDVDHFKSINDVHGHPVGDKVLLRIAQTLQQALPTKTELSRVGGEEFMVLLPNATVESALELAHVLRARVRAATLDLGVRTEGVTISIGIATRGHGEPGSAQDIYAAADEALYQAKTGGRDRACVYRRAGRNDGAHAPGASLPDLDDARPA
jgi:diguanylate cyclase (GGDEF)-like protein